MRCRQAQKSLSAALDGELAEPRDGAANAHAAQCPRCQRFAAQLRGGVEALARLTVPEPRSGFTRRLLARLPERQTRPILSGIRFEALRPAHLAAAGFALACGVVLALAMNGERTARVSEHEEPAETFYAECFAAAPPDSAGGRYLALLLEAER